MIYAWRYPKSIHRSVMIGVNPPGHFLWDAKTTDEQIRRYAALCAKDDVLPQADATTSPRRCGRRPRDIPDRWLVPADQGGQRADRLVLRADGVDVGGGAALGADDARLVALGRRRATRAGSGSMSLLAELAFPEVVRLGRRRRRRAGPTPRRASATSRPARDRGDSILGNPGTDVHLGRRPARSTPGRRTPDENEYSRVRTSNVETLLIGGTLDFATPPQNATQGAPAATCRTATRSCCPSSATRPRSGATSRRPSTRLINTFLDSGKVDDVALHAADGRLHARRDADRARQGHRRRDARPRARSTVLSLLLDGAPRAQARRASDARRAPCSGRCTRSCSAWAAGSSAS